MFRFFLDNRLITMNHPGFKPGDSCINELLSVTHHIYNSFDDGLEIKEFNRLKQDVITCYVRNVTDFIYQRKQRTAMNGTSLKWANVVASVSQGSMFRPLFFLIYINDLNFLIFIGQFNCKSKAACV